MPNQVRQRLSGPTLYRAATTEAVIDEEQRIVRVSFSSETPYKRSSWFDEPWIEILGHKGSEVDMSRLNGGAAPVLYGHSDRTRRDHVGVIERAWLEGDRGYAEVRLSKRDDVSDLWRDIVDKIVRNISVGYQILERVLVKKNEKVPSEYRVTRWLPMEISFVPIPADATVGVGRSESAPDSKFIITDCDLEERQMPKNAVADVPAQDDSPTAGAAAAPTGPTTDQVRAEAQRAERDRVTAINDVVTKAKAPHDLAARAIREGLTIEQTREAVINHFASQDVDHAPSAVRGGDEADKFRNGALAWLLFRANEKGDDGKQIRLEGNEFRGARLLDLATRALMLAGTETRGLTASEIATRAIGHSTSDFPILLQNLLNKTLLTAYSATPATWRRFCAIGNMSDFRPHYRYRIGSFNDLAAVSENNEFLDGTISDAERESIQAATKGRILNLSRRMIIDDDMGAFVGVSRMLGQAAGRTVEKDVFALFALNSSAGPTMSDGDPLFHADHANIAATAALPTVDSFDAARVQMASQTDPGSNEIIDIRPAVWLGPLGLEGQAKVVNDAQYDPDTSNKLQRPNKSRGLFRDIVGTPRLTGTRWYAFADANEDPVIEVGFLDGQQSPVIEMQEGFRVDGVSWKVRLDYGVAAVGWRGAITNAGS